MRWGLKNNIILIGYMGCGKSTIGKALAKKKEKSFLDTDAYIEAKEGCLISQIFAEKGEMYFRDLETKVLKELLEDQDEPGIISVGGGLPVREENQELLKQLGRVIYLKATPETLYDRLKGDTTRPLLQTTNPKEKIKEMLAVREEKYQAAAYETIVVDGKKIEDIVEEICIKNEKSF